jgi:hypothetical protein
MATKKSSGRKSSSKKSSSRKSSSRSSGRKSASKKSSSSSKKKSSSRKYGSKAQKEVRTEMHHLKKGEHKNRKQAIAIGLSKARRAGGKVPRKKK